MRTSFIDTLCEVAERRDDIWLVCGDLGYSVLERFAVRFPDRFVNAGVAEQNMTGLAAGLALAGQTVVTYSIANFPVMRCLEQIRNDVCYHDLDVKIVAVGGGLAYGSAGYSHHGQEDLAVMRVLPNMTVLAPGDPVEARLATLAMFERPGPCYLRLGKAGEPRLHEREPDFAIGRAIELRPGRAVTLVSTGGILDATLAAADALAAEGLEARVLSMPTLAPLDAAAVLAAAAETGGVLTIEEHGLGGLGSAVAEVLAEHGAGGRFKALRLGREAESRCGSQASLRAAQGLDPAGIARAARALVGER